MLIILLTTTLVTTQPDVLKRLEAHAHVLRDLPKSMGILTKTFNDAAAKLRR